MSSTISGPLPLLRHFEAHSALAYVHGNTISARQFLQRATMLATQLPLRRHVINTCEDRYHFLLGFAAALIAGQTSLMPSSRAPDVITSMQGDYPDSYCLSDQMLAEGAAGDSFAWDPAAAGGYVIPSIASDHVAAILFTSGSTGHPTAHSKTWAMLTQGADQLHRAFNVQSGARIVGTIPPQHMFGLESTIMFPLQWGCAVFHGRPHLPADIERVVKSVGSPAWLMTTPLHLQACVAERPDLTGLAGAVSATMPLAQPEAQSAENMLNCPLHEIYGSTEAGITATRRPAITLNWQLCPDFDIRQEDGRHWLQGPRVMQKLMLSDSITPHGARSFSLHGRIGDMIKIAGKRTSLAALDKQLLSIDGVRDGAFHRPEPKSGHGHDNQRLTAFVVGDGVTVRQILDGLRQRIDPIFIPRPLWIVDGLPRDANGKLPRSALAALALQMIQPSPAAPICIQAEVASDNRALDGHFPGNPIVPGVLLISEVMRLASGRHNVTGIRQAKFHVPLLPRQRYAISLSDAAANLLKFTIHHDSVLIASGSLQLDEARDAE